MLIGQVRHRTGCQSLTSGCVFSLGSGAVSWNSKKQPIAALSSTEAEYRGTAMAACEIA